MRYSLPVFVAISLLTGPLHALKPADKALDRATDSSTVENPPAPVTSIEAGAGSLVGRGLTELGSNGLCADGNAPGASGICGGVPSKPQAIADAVKAAAAKAVAAASGLTKTPGRDNAAVAGKATVFTPAATPEAAQAREEVSRLVESNDPAAAREYAVAALARNPTDPALMSYVKLTAPSRTAVDSKTVSKRVFLDSLLLDQTDSALTSSHRLGRFNCIAMLLLIGEPMREAAAQLLKDISTQSVPRRAPLVSSASPVRDGAMLRIAGESVEEVGRELHRHVQVLAVLLGDDPWARKW